MVRPNAEGPLQASQLQDFLQRHEHNSPDNNVAVNPANPTSTLEAGTAILNASNPTTRLPGRVNKARRTTQPASLHLKPVLRRPKTDISNPVPDPLDGMMCEKAAAPKSEAIL